jgi:hypothetical protein
MLFQRLGRRRFFVTLKKLRHPFPFSPSPSWLWHHRRWRLPPLQERLKVGWRDAPLRPTTNTCRDVVGLQFTGMDPTERLAGVDSQSLSNLRRR